jgi:guanylate kinase
MTENEKGLLYVISGPSGVGKDTILGRFLPGAPDCALSVSATTRGSRPGEVHGREYLSRQGVY